MAEEPIVKFNLAQEAVEGVILEVMVVTMVVAEDHFQKLMFWNEFTRIGQNQTLDSDELYTHPSGYLWWTVSIYFR